MNIKTAVAALALLASSAGHAATTLADAAECKIRGELTGRVASALNAGTVTLSDVQAEAAKGSDREKQRLNFTLSHYQALRNQGEHDPLAFAASAAATCMMGR
ncbi:hypothetical protein [Burkholderia oklahomensis]|uniref:hypothetical protein n=1 Tax=Burkholderia oklahomensis TaxID=342113 RepID=UPI0012FD7D62|nr:hypothetical protein [Burkholderia oklahomensis]